MRDMMENLYEQICQIQEIFNFNNFNISYFLPDTWYVLESGSDIGGCGRTPDSACSTLLYLLQQVNRTHLPPSMTTQVPPSKETDPVNRTQVPPSMEIDPDNRTHLPPPTGMDPDNQTQVGPVKDIDPVNWTQVPPFMDNHPDDWTKVPPSRDIDLDNQTQLPPSKELDIITDKDLNIDQKTAVSTLFSIITSNYRQT